VLRKPDEDCKDQSIGGDLLFSADGTRLVFNVGGRLEVYSAQSHQLLRGIDVEDVETDTFWLTGDNRFFVAHGGTALTIIDLQTSASIESTARVDEFSSIVIPSPSGRQLLTMEEEGSTAYVQEIHGLLDFTTESLVTRVCEKHLAGGSTLSAADAIAAPILYGLAGEDVCAPPTFRRHWKRIIASF